MRFVESRMVVTPYNNHRWLLSPGTWLVCNHQSLLGRRSRHCYGIITLKSPCKITLHGARWWGDSRSDVPFTRIRGGLTFLIEQFWGRGARASNDSNRVGRPFYFR